MGDSKLTITLPLRVFLELHPHAVEGSIQSLGHQDVVAGDLEGHIRSKRGGAGFVVAETAVKGRKGRACADDAEVDRDTASLAEKILSSIH